MYLKPLMFFKRQLHVFNFAKGGIRKKYGSTRSEGLSRGTLVKDLKFGKCLVGGSSKGKISLNDLSSNKRLTQHAIKTKLKVLTNLKWNII